MSNTIHTPGLWEVCTSMSGIPFVFTHEDNLGAIANMTGRKEDHANAKLIAAATELLEALTVCYKSLCTYGSHPIIEKQIDAAIKKATL